MHHNLQNGDSPSNWDILKGIFIGVCVFIYKLWQGFIAHNGGYEEIFYSVITLTLFGLLGTGVSYYGNRFWKWLHKDKK